MDDEKQAPETEPTDVPAPEPVKEPERRDPAGDESRKQEPEKPEPVKADSAKAEAPKADSGRKDAPPRQQQNQRREERPPRPAGENRGPGGGPGGGERRGPPRDDRRPGGGGDRGGPREGGRPGGDRRPFEGPADIEIEKLISDSLYLDNQAHAVVARMRDMDSGTKSQLRRLYNAVRRAVRAPESERQHQFVMLRARLAYTIARHSLRSLDALERLLLQVTRKNDARGYERFKDLFEAIVAYNE
jgi:CRISPR type III-A-associated protein Csm2